MYSSTPRIDASTLSSVLSSPFFSWTYYLSISYFGCKALCFVVSFLDLLFICSSLVHFKNGLEKLTRGTVHVFIPLMRFLLQSLFREVFSFIWYTLFLFFISSPLVWLCPLPISPNSRGFPFLLEFWFFFDSSIPSVICIFPLLIIRMGYFYILTVYCPCSH